MAYRVGTIIRMSRVAKPRPAIMVIAMLTKKTFGQKEDQAQDGGAGGQDHGAHAADARVENGLVRGLAGGDLLVDLLDEDDGVLDQQTDQE